jgi:hypothetical protein
MPLPTNFGHPPGEEPHRTFRNTCIVFKKTLKISKNPEELEQLMQRFIEESKQMDWHHRDTAVYHKDEGEKLADKVCTEFQRYATALQTDAAEANPADILTALDLVEQYIKSFKVT